MKVKLLMIIAFSIFLALSTFTVFVFLINSGFVSSMYIGGGAIDLDPDLSPSYAYDSHGYLKFNSIFVAGPIILGIISLVFLVPNIILRTKKIPTRKYMLVIAAGVLFFFGFSYISNGIPSILTLEQLEEENDWIRLIGGLIAIGIGLIFIIPGIVLLRKAKLRIRK